MAKKNVVEVEQKPETVSIPDKVEKYVSSLKCELTPEEIAQRANQCANIVSEIDAAEADAKAAAKHAKAAIEEQHALLRRLSQEVASGTTYRPIECERRFIYEESMVKEFRGDTSALLGARRMTERERQLMLPIEDEPDGAWKLVPLADTPVANVGGALKLLATEGVTTLGELSDFQAKHGDFWPSKIKGVGPETAGKIADAAAEYWKRS